MNNIEYLIVGNGLAGTLLAFEMLDLGMNFRIMVSPEKSKASMVAAGMFNPLVFKRMTKSWMADELLPVMKRRYFELEDRLNEKFFFEKDILKPLSGQEMLLWEERRIDPEFIKYIQSVNTDGQFSGTKIAAGFGVVTQSGYLKLPVFLGLAEKFFRRENKIIDETFRFETFNPESGPWQHGEWNFTKIIFCEGSHASENTFFNFLPLRPVKGEILEIYAPQLSEEFILNKKVFVLPIGNQRFKVGSTYEWEDLTGQPTQKGKKSIIMRLDELISADYQIEHHRAGIRPTVSDRRPLLGRHPKWNQLYIFNGLGTKGVMLGPYFTREFIKTLTISNYSLSEEVNIERFI